ncbi:MAG: penicillin-binding transpeptidase domain-containing protein [Anaerolineae bacterium]
MTFTREISRLMFGLLLAFFMIVASAGYWAIVGAEDILQRNDNPRLVEDEARIQRGSIYDRQGVLLAQTRSDDNGMLQRIYHYPETYSALGYFSLRYGTAGAEAAYDDYLRGEIELDTLNSVIQREWLHQPQQGLDIRLTLDRTLQQVIVEQMTDYSGAVIVLNVPDGAVLGLVSLPTYDPNRLSTEWENFVASDGNPFFNRALQGQYQPGGMLQTPLMVAGILTQQPFDIVTAAANRPIPVGDMQLNCARQPQDADLSYTEAYAYACPFPFALLARELNPSSLQNILAAFRLDSPPRLQGFVSDDLPVLQPENTPESMPELTLMENVIGQGNLTITPLSMATIASAIINDGNAPQPYVLDAYRSQQSTWIPQLPIATSTPLMTADAARRLQGLMIENTRLGASVPAARDSLTVGAHTALAISGDEIQTWFIGFVSTGTLEGVAVALVLEDVSDASEAARIGGIILEQAVMSTQGISQ